MNRRTFIRCVAGAAISPIAAATISTASPAKPALDDDWELSSRYKSFVSSLHSSPKTMSGHKTLVDAMKQMRPECNGIDVISDEDVILWLGVEAMEVKIIGDRLRGERTSGFAELRQ